MILNKYNFLRWDDGTPEPGQPEPPVAYIKDRGHYGYMPVLKPGEATSFYINTEDGLLYDFADLRIGLVAAHTGNMVAANIGVLQQHFIDDTLTPYNIYCTLVNPAANDGAYYFMIYKNSDSSEVMRSNYLLVRNGNVEHETMYCKFRHDRTFYNIKYHELEGFYQQFRLNITMIERQPESDREIYKEVTTGAYQVYNAVLNRYLKFETYYFDSAAHEAATVMIEHSEVLFNGRNYTIKSPYREPAVLSSKIAKGEFEMYDDGFASVNRC